MKAAIVILNFNGKEMLKQFLPSVVKNSVSEIIIVDNKSTDGSVDFLASTYPKLEVICTQQNRGYAGGYNEGLFAIGNRYEYFILLNSDVEVTPDWDSTLIDFLDEHQEVAGAQPKILSFSSRNHFDYAGASGGFLDQLGYPYCRGRVLHTVEKDMEQYNDPVEVDWASGACFIIRSKIFLNLGGFEPLFFSHMEEVDLCWRIRNRGMKLMVIPKSTVFHVGGGTLSKSNPYKTFLNFRNNLLMLYRNLDTTSFVKIFLARILLDGLASGHLLLTQGKGHAKAVYQAYRGFLSMRKGISKDVVLAPKLPLAPKEKKVFSIILAYYFRRKKIFSKL